MTDDGRPPLVADRRYVAAAEGGGTAVGRR